jgi:ATP-dependent RNA helicase RhlE
MPDTADAYTHRIGRTGRAEQAGEAFSLYTPADVDSLRAVERILGRRLERRTLPGFDYRGAGLSRSPEPESDLESRPETRPIRSSHTPRPAGPGGRLGGMRYRPSERSLKITSPDGGPRPAQ